MRIRSWRTLENETHILFVLPDNEYHKLSPREGTLAASMESISISGALSKAAYIAERVENKGMDRNPSRVMY